MSYLSALECYARYPALEGGGAAHQSPVRYNDVLEDLRGAARWGKCAASRLCHRAGAGLSLALPSHKLTPGQCALLGYLSQQPPGCRHAQLKRSEAPQQRGATSQAGGLTGLPTTLLASRAPSPHQNGLRAPRVSL